MLNPERRDMESSDMLQVLGKENYEKYAHFAVESNVPPELYEISRRLTLDEFNTASVRTVASLVFDMEFNDEMEAWRTLKYAEAISAIRQFDLVQNEEDFTEEEFEKKLGEVELAVGTSAIINLEVHLAEVKNRVERYFVNPLNQMRLLFIGAMDSNSAAA